MSNYTTFKNQSHFCDANSPARIKLRSSQLKHDITTLLVSDVMSLQHNMWPSSLAEESFYKGVPPRRTTRHRRSDGRETVQSFSVASLHKKCAWRERLLSGAPPLPLVCPGEVHQGSFQWWAIVD